MKKNLRVSKKFVYLCISELVFLCFSIYLKVDFLFLISFMLWSNMIIYTLSDFSRHIYFTTFLACFFVFLLGGQVVHEYFNYELPYNLGKEIYKHMNISLIISLLCLFTGYYLFDKFGLLRTTMTDKMFNSKQSISLRKVAKVAFFATYIPWVALIIEKGIHVYRTSYHELYTSYSTSFPYVLVKMAEIAPIAFYTYLATMPTKKECRVPLFLYFLYGTLTLITGHRLYFMTAIIFIFVYFVIRNKINNGGVKWISNKQILFSVLAAPILLIGLYAYNYFRVGKSFEFTSIMDSLLGFFRQQGFSSSLIRLGKYHEASLNDNFWYSFYGLTKYWRKNLITNLFVDFNYGFTYGSYTIEEAVYGNSLSSALSYIVLGEKYLNGTGLGSCYIAEAYQDLGYIGVALANLIYAVVIIVLNKAVYKNTISVTISFILLESLVRAPRYNFDVIFASFIDVSTWGILLFLWLIAKVLATDNFIKRKSRDILKVITVKLRGRRQIE